jgi:RNA polymerase sigma factor (TIGR02999 family)
MDNDVTRILRAVQGGDARAASELLPLVYNELRRLAALRVSQERPGSLLQATALVHEAYLRLVGEDQPLWDGRGHFFAAAAEAMRRILIEQARRARRVRHGGEVQRQEMPDVAAPGGLPLDELIDLDEALKKLAEQDAVKAELVKLRYFAGLTLEQAAAMLGISRATADRYWVYARAWLYDAIHGRGKGEAGNEGA